MKRSKLLDSLVRRKLGGSQLEVQHHKFITKHPSTQHEFQRNYARGDALAVQSIFARVRNLGRARKLRALGPNRVILKSNRVGF